MKEYYSYEDSVSDLLYLIKEFQEINKLGLKIYGKYGVRLWYQNSYRGSSRKKITLPQLQCLGQSEKINNPFAWMERDEGTRKATEDKRVLS